MGYELKDLLRVSVVKRLASTELVQSLAEPLVVIVVESDEAEAELGVCLPLYSAAHKFDQANDRANGRGYCNLSQRASLDIRSQQCAAAGHGKPAKRAFHQFIFYSKIGRLGVWEGRPWSSNRRMNFRERCHTKTLAASGDR